MPHNLWKFLLYCVYCFVLMKFAGQWTCKNRVASTFGIIRFDCYSYYIQTYRTFNVYLWERLYFERTKPRHQMIKKWGDPAIPYPQNWCLWIQPFQAANSSYWCAGSLFFTSSAVTSLDTVANKPACLHAVGLVETDVAQEHGITLTSGYDNC